MVKFKNLFSRRYSNFQFETFDSAKANTARSHLFRKYLRENESFSKTILSCLSGAQMGYLVSLRKKCQDISWHCHFKVTTPITVISMCLSVFITSVAWTINIYLLIYLRKKGILRYDPQFSLVLSLSPCLHLYPFIYVYWYPSFLFYLFPISGPGDIARGWPRVASSCSSGGSLPPGPPTCRRRWVRRVQNYHAQQKASQNCLSLFDSLFV